MPHVPRERPALEGPVGYVYLIHMGDAHKIGRCKSWRNRCKAYAGLPYRVTLLALLRSFDMMALERSLHGRYARRRLRGEWFALTPADVAEIQAHPQRIDQEV